MNTIRDSGQIQDLKPSAKGWQKKFLQNILLFIIILYAILRAWQGLELQIYGEIQERVVDNIIVWPWMLFVVLAYVKGYADNK